MNPSAWRPLRRLATPGVLLLRRYAWGALGVLEDPGFAPPEGAVVGVGIEAAETAAAIRPVLERFESTLKRLELQQRRAEETQRLKDEALARRRQEQLQGVDCRGQSFFVP